MDVPFVLNRSFPEPLWRQIYAQWRAGILSGRFRRGERVPSGRALAEACGLARITVTAAYDQLLAEGYFETRHGSGTFVSAELPDDAFRPVRASPPSSRIPLQAARLSRFGQRVRLPQRSIPAGLHALNLSMIAPDIAEFPFLLWRRLLSRQLRSAPSLFRNRGDAAGIETLREAIASYLARTRAVRCTPEQVIVAGGSQQALDLCARLLLDPGGRAVIEEPGYIGARRLFLAHGAKLGTLPVTGSGASAAKIRGKPLLVHVTPSHQFPTGVSMSLARRLELIEWARTNRAVVLEDDYDSEYRYTGPPLPAMQSLAEGANVIYLGTFSNVMFRGLRIGYLVVPRDLVAPFTAAKWMADRHTPLLEQAALAGFIAEGHLDRHIRRMRKLYKRRRDAVIEALDRHFGDRVSVRGDAAGLHLTVRFRRPPNLNGVRLVSTAPYYQSKPARNEFIIGFASLGERTLREAIKRLAA